jgi:hypothetical protein
MPSITDPEVRAFLTEGTCTGKLGYLSATGRPAGSWPSSR